MKDTTFIMAFFNINNNQRHNLEHYKKCIPRTFRIMPNSKIVFFYQDNEIFELIKRRCKTSTIIPKKIEISQLPTYNITKNYLNSLKKLDLNLHSQFENQIEKGLSHFNEWKINGDTVYHQILTVWTSKLFMINQIIKENPFKTNNFSWVDISLGKTVEKRPNWNWMINLYPNNKISFYPSNMTYYGNKLNLSAGFMFGNKDKFIELFELYQKKLNENENDIYGHDEETLLNLIYQENQNLFHIIN
jgi:hypothetical protein